ncbi:MAG: response regulator transcription factor [Saprospiraceae bacterium]|nr:response regulator transcription factor [Saprospiraceae bacterium]
MKILIVEDEPIAAKRLEKLIEEVEPNVQVLTILDSIESTVNWLQTSPVYPDLMFLDIHLADGSSFEIFQMVEVKCPVIFSTAYDDYAIKAFKVNAIDYLLKPVKKPELQEAFRRMKQFNPAPGMDYAALARELHVVPRRFLIRFGQQIRVVQVDNVAYFFTSDKITFLVDFEGKKYPMDQSLDSLEELVDTKDFFRINRQFIINFRAIQEMYSYSKSRVKLKLKPAYSGDLIVSTERSPLFKKWLTGTH